MVRNASVACISRRLLTGREEMANLRGRVYKFLKVSCEFQLHPVEGDL